MMSIFIASRIILESNSSLEEGQAKYRAYFVNTHLYAKWQDEVDSILRIDGYGESIVTK